MPSPQVENGYLRIANELFDAITRYPFTKRQYKVLLYVIRKTYGFGKKTDDMTVTQIANGTGLDRSPASKALEELAEIGAVTKRHGTHGYIVGISKDYGQWAPVTKHHDRDKTSRGACQNVTGGVTKRHTQKTTPKDNSKRQEGARARGLVTIDRFLEDCRTSREKPVPPDDPVFAYAEEAGIPHDHLRLCWLEFVERNRARKKRYKSWRQAFRNCVREGWYQLWWIDAEGNYSLTTKGKQAEKKHQRAA